jgi:hypothetical protein
VGSRFSAAAGRPEAGQKLHAGFQRHVDRQASRYAEQLAHAAQLADRFECGDVIGVFSTQTGGDIRPRAYVVGLLPVTAIPVLSAGAQVIEVGEVWAMPAFPTIGEIIAAYAGKPFPRA